MGLLQRASGDYAGAQRQFTLAVKPRNDFYAALAMAELGEAVEARNLLSRLLEYARQLAREQPKIDYFATSLPTMLLFDEDLKQRNILTGRFIEAQARHGLGQKKRSRALIREILEQDPNHGPAADFAVEMDCLAEVRVSVASA